MVFVADDEGRYVAVNRQACETLGYSRRDLLGMTVPEVAVAPEARELYETMLREGRLQGTTPIRCSDGRLLTFRYWAKGAAQPRAAGDPGHEPGAEQGDCADCGEEHLTSWTVTEVGSVVQV